MALLLGVDRFMAEARAITNLIGNAVATLVIAKMEKVFVETTPTISVYRHRATTPVVPPVAIENDAVET